MEERETGVRALTPELEVEIVDVPHERRAGLESILEESFEGWYLRHSRSTLREVETVREALASGASAGLVMLKQLEPGVAYVYYIAVARAHRRKGVAKALLEDALGRFIAAGAREVFAGVEADNEPSERLFVSEGFVRTSFGEVSKRHGTIHAINMYRAMRIVPGEFLLRKDLG